MKPHIEEAPPQPCFVNADPARLADRLSAGDAAAYEELYRALHGPLCRYLTRLLGDPEQAADVCQETFLRAYRSLSGVRALHDPRAWIFAVASRQGVSVLRRRGVKRRLLHLLPIREEHVEARVADRDELDRALRKLPETQRAALLLSFEGFRYAEIAEILGTSEMAIKLRMHRAKQRLKEIVET